MNGHGMNNSGDDVVECPLCMEPLEVDDLNFYPCTCGYQICRFCWHRIRTDENKLCPACRKEYPENPADFTPLTQEQMIAFKSQKRQRDQQRKQKITENRKHLANVRVVQKNLVFVVGLPPRLADADILKKHEYFGKYGKIHKVVINPSTTYAGVQGPSASAYVTYVHNSDALRAIQSVNNIMIDGRLIKTSLGTTKYCSHFMKNQQCPKADCMYLHELGDSEASFTKEEMHQGKHQEYEKRLHDALIASAGANTTNGIGQGMLGASGTSTGGTSKINASSSSMSSSLSSTASVVSTTAHSTANVSGAAQQQQQQKEAWPSLSMSPINSKESSAISNNSKSKKEKVRNEKIRNEKIPKQKVKNINQTNSNSTTLHNKESHSTEAKYCTNSETTAAASEMLMASNEVTTTTKLEKVNGNIKSRVERNKEKSISSRTNSKEMQPKDKISGTGSEEDIKYMDGIDDKCSSDNSSSATTKMSSRIGQSHASKITQDVSETPRSLSSSSNNSDDQTSGISDSCASGKSSPGFPDSHLSSSLNAETNTTPTTVELKTSVEISGLSSIDNTTLSEMLKLGGGLENETPTNNLGGINNHEKNETDKTDNLSAKDIANTSEHMQAVPNNITNSDNVLNTTSGLSKLNLFDDSNSFFSSTTPFQQSLLLKNKLTADFRHNQINSGISSHLPDLLNEWEEAFKSVMMRNNKHVEEQLLHQQQLQQQQQQHHQQLLQQQEEFLRLHDLQKRNNLLNNIGLTQINGPHNDFPNNFVGNDLSRFSHAALLQQQQQQQQQLLHQQQQQQQQQTNENLLSSGLFGASMSKFFDFHKSQQQMHQQVLNGHTGGINSSNANINDSLRMGSFLENNSRTNSQFMDSSLITQQQQQQLQKHRLLGKFDSVPQQTTHQSRLQNQFSQNTPADDDLGFDPFIETQKALAELMENEVVQQNANTSNVNGSSPSKLMQHQPQVAQQQQLIDNMQRTRMPPPGFNHMNAFGFGVSRNQNASKILPFMNVSTANANGSSGGQMGHQQQMPISSNWNPHMGAFQQPQSQQSQQLPLNDSQLQHQLNPNHGAPNHSKGYGGTNDWTAMDPAILSFRQFSSFPQQNQMSQQQQQQQQQQDMFLQHLAQQQQQNGQGFSNQAQLLPGINMPNNLLNVQQSSQAQVNANVQGMLEFLKNRQFV